MSKRLPRICGPKITKKQRLRLLEMMKDSPELEYGNRGVYMKNACAREVAIRRWKEIANELNNMDGTVHKEWQSWKKTWSDIRSKMQEDWSSVVETYLKRNTVREYAPNSYNGGEPKATQKLSYISEMFCDDDNHSKDEQELGDFNECSSFRSQKFSTRSEKNIDKNEESEYNADNFNRVAKIEYNSEKEYSEPSVIQINSRQQNIKHISTNDSKQKRKRSHNNYKKRKISFSQIMQQYTSKKAKVKEEYYSKKLLLLERDVIAKESIASSLRILTEGRSDLFQLS